MDVIGQVTRPVAQAQHPGHSGHMFGVVARKSYISGCSFQWLSRSPKCAAITGVGVDMSPHCFIKCPNGSASYTASGSKV